MRVFCFKCVALQFDHFRFPCCSFIYCNLSVCCSVLDKDSIELKVLADVVIKIQKKPLVAVKNYHHHQHFMSFEISYIISCHMIFDFI